MNIEHKDCFALMSNNTCDALDDLYCDKDNKCYMKCNFYKTKDEVNMHEIILLRQIKKTKKQKEEIENAS